MLEPFSAATTAANVAGLCLKATGYLYTFIRSAEVVDATVDALYLDVDSLSKIFRSLAKHFQAISIDGIISPSERNYEEEYWENVVRSMNDCKRTMEDLRKILEKVNKDEVRGIMRRTTKRIKLGMKSVDIERLKQQIAIYHRTMHLSLQLISVYVPFLDFLTVSSYDQKNETSINVLHQKIDRLNVTMGDIQVYLNAPPRRQSRSSMGSDDEVDEPQVIEHLNDCLVAAKKLVSVQTQNAAAASENDDPQSPVSPSDDADLDYEVIQHSLKSGNLKFATKDYATAVSFLQKVLEKSEEKYGSRSFPWRDETIRMLAASYCQLGNWKEADDLFDKEFDGRDELMESLANEFFQREQRDGAWMICTGKEFEGKEKIMDLLATYYFRAKRWDKAKKSLIELQNYDAEENIRLQRTHMLAQVCFNNKEYEEATMWCRKTVNGRQKLLGKRHHLFYQSINLLTQICLAKGDLVEARVFQEILTELPPGLQGISLHTSSD